MHLLQHSHTHVCCIVPYPYRRAISSPMRVCSQVAVGADIVRTVRTSSKEKNSPPRTYYWASAFSRLEPEGRRGIGQNGHLPVGFVVC